MKRTCVIGQRYILLLELNCRDRFRRGSYRQLADICSEARSKKDVKIGPEIDGKGDDKIRGFP